MKAVMLSVRPRWCELIISGKKTVEARKTRPKIKTPFLCYIYCTSGNPTVNIPISDARMRADALENGMKCMNCPIGNGKVIGEFICDKLVWVVSHPAVFAGHTLLHTKAIADACLTKDEAEAYSGGKDVFGWHISDLVLYDKPRELNEFKNHGDRLTRAPQSWCYVEELT